jgi:hypothetical protein
MIRAGDITVGIASIACGVVFLLCLAAFPVIDYVGGWQCEPPSVPPLLPAEVVPFGVGLCAAVGLLVILVKSLRARRRRAGAVVVGTLIGVVAATVVFALYAGQLPGFLHGLRDRFVADVGYDKTRDFAREVSQKGFALGPNGLMQHPARADYPQSPESLKQWDRLAGRYPFLNWGHGGAGVIVRGGIVEVYWGGALLGHWGFQVAPAGKVGQVDEDRCRMLRVSDDIQFVCGD